MTEHLGSMLGMSCDIRLLGTSLLLNYSFQDMISSLPDLWIHIEQIMIHHEIIRIMFIIFLDMLS